MYSHFEWYLEFGLTQVDDINYGTTIHVVCPVQPIPCLLMFADFRSQNIKRQGIDPKCQNIPSAACEPFDVFKLFIESIIWGGVV